MTDPRTIWKRRAVLMTVVGLLVAIPVTIIVRGGDPGDEPPITSPEAPEVGEVEFDRDLGVELRLPAGWKRKRERGAVTFRSRDGTVLIAASTPGPAKDVEPIHEAAVAAVKSQYRAVDVVKRIEGRKLGDRPAQIAAIAARNPKSRSPMRILVATAKGEKLAYLVEVFAAGRDPSAALVEAQVLLNNLRLKG